MAKVHVLDIARDVAQVCKKCPNGTLQAAIIRSARGFLRQSRWYRSALTGATAQGVRAYGLGSDPYEEVIGIRAMSFTQSNSQPWPLAVSDPTQWWPGTQQGAPRRFAYIPEGQFAIDPLPDGVYPLTLSIVLIPKAGQNQIEESVLAKWDQAIQAGALAYLLNLNEPWRDAHEAQRQSLIYQSGINNAKADEQREYQRGSQRAKPRAIIA